MQALSQLSYGPGSHESVAPQLAREAPRRETPSLDRRPCDQVGYGLHWRELSGLPLTLWGGDPSADVGVAGIGCVGALFGACGAVGFQGLHFADRDWSGCFDDGWPLVRTGRDARLIGKILYGRGTRGRRSGAGADLTPESDPPFARHALTAWPTVLRTGSRRRRCAPAQPRTRRRLPRVYRAAAVACARHLLPRRLPPRMSPGERHPRGRRARRTRASGA